MFQKLRAWAKGKKTYFAGAAAIGIAAASYYGVHVPDFVTYGVLGVFGITIRAGMKNDAVNAVAAFAALVKDVQPTNAAK